MRRLPARPLPRTLPAEGARIVPEGTPTCWPPLLLCHVGCCVPVRNAPGIIFFVVSSSGCQRHRRIVWRVGPQPSPPVRLWRRFSNLSNRGSLHQKAQDERAKDMRRTHTNLHGAMEMRWWPHLIGPSGVDPISPVGAADSARASWLAHPQQLQSTTIHILSRIFGHGEQRSALVGRPMYALPPSTGEPGRAV